MKATVSVPESWKRVIEVEIPVDEVNKAFEDKLNKYKKELKLPGFRPGKVPSTLIKQRFGGSIRAEAVDELVQKTFREACEQNKIYPIAQAKVSDVKAEENSPVLFTIETEVDPEIQISGYDKLKVKVSTKKIKDSDVDDAVKNLRERFAEFKDIDHPSQKGDYVKIEYLNVVVDGEERKEIQNPAYPIELGGDNKVKDFDKGLTGHSAGEIVDLDIKFPKDYAETDVAGKTVQFKIKIVAVQEKILPEINEDFLKKIGNFKDEDAFRVDLKANLEQEESKRAKEDAYNEAIEKIANENPFDVPPARIAQFIDYMHNESTKYNRPGTPIPAREEIESLYKDTAIRTIKRQRIIDFIAQKENIKATQEEVDLEIQKMADMYKQPFDTLKQTFRKNGTTNRIRDEIREHKTLDYLIGEYTPPAQE